MKHIAIFASGSGTNAENIIRHFQNSGAAKVVAVFSNKADAGILKKAEALGIPQVVFSKSDFLDNSVLEQIYQFEVDLIVLAGFLWQFPETIINAFPNKIVNIHPALLPKYGGKGMYGMNVHRAIIENREKQTGVTIHYIDEHYDEGDIIFQQSVRLNGNESCEEVAGMVQRLEHQHYPRVIAEIINKMEQC